MPDQRQSIMVVDDDPAQRRLMGGFVESQGYQVVEAASAEAMLQAIQQSPPDMVLLDVRLPGISGIEAIPEIRKIAPNLPVLLITAYADLKQAVAAVKSGAADYLAKPVDLDELAVAVAEALGAESQPQTTGGGVTRDLPPGFVCQSAAMRRLIDTISVIAPSDAPILILGESGTGKEVVAQLIHRWSSRAERPMIAANCAGWPETLVESELFGHRKGAFTGASDERQGLFRTADGGTLLLDEIGELPLHIQPRLLRALETHEIVPVGSDKAVRVDTRLVAATNRDLSEEVRDGRFREDLYYRINVVELIVPPLSERRGDIPQLAKQFATEFAGRAVRLSPQAMHCLLAHSWTGNVRELRNAIHRACLLCRGDVILPEHLPPNVARLVSQNENGLEPAGRLSQVERATILATLEECDGNRTHAAKKLGISRRALIYKLRAIESEQPFPGEENG